MSDFKRLKKQQRIKKVNKDKAKARGLLKRAERRYDNQKQRKISEKNAFEILENVYESLREVIEAGMAAEGLKSEDHVATISYAEEKLDIETSHINKLHRFRKLRNKSRYEAQEIQVEEAEQIIKLAETLLETFKEQVNQKL